MTKFLFEGVHPVSLEGRFLRARLCTKETKTTLIIEEFKLYARDREKCPRLFKEFSIPLPDDVFKNYEHDRIVGNPLCIGSQRQFIILQYITQRCLLIHFMVVNTEQSSVEACHMTCRHFLREYCLAAPLECFLDVDCPSCIIRLSPTMLRVQRSLAIQSVVFKSSECNDKEILLKKRNTMIGFEDVSSVKNSRFLNVLPTGSGKVLLVTVNEFCAKFTFEILDTATLVTTKMTTRYVSSECNLVQSRACQSRAGDLICIACLTVDNQFMENFNSVWRLQVFTFEESTFEKVSRFIYDVNKWFYSEVNTVSGEIMLTVSNSDTMLEVWNVKRLSHPSFIKGFKLYRKNVVSLKTQCRSTILKHINEWELRELHLPRYIEQYLQFK